MPGSTNEINARWRSGPGRSFVLAFSVVAIALGASGCVRRATVEGGFSYDYPVVHVETVPADIYGYPRVYYQGGYAYLVGDRWYYEGPRGWVIFRVEPRELAEQRVYIGRSPPRGAYPSSRPPRYYEERPPPPPPQEPVERGRRYYPE